MQLKETEEKHFCWEERKDEEGEMLTLKWKKGGKKRGLISQEGKGFQTKL